MLLKYQKINDNTIAQLFRNIMVVKAKDQAYIL